jgi:TRAP-type C4-dicarboxylate transport system substrate-binding protein
MMRAKHVLTVAFATLSIAGGLAGTASAQTQWELPTNYAASAFHTRNIVQFAADVEKATGGSLKIAVHPGGTMIKHAEIKRAVSDGKVAAGEVLISLAADEAPVYGVDSIPFLATGYDGARKLYDAQRPFLEKQLAKEGLVLLFSVPWPPQGIYAKREIKSVDDLKGLKFRTYNAMTKRIAELAGAQPTQIEVPDLPAAFSSGRVDVMITSASSGVQSKAEEYLTHYMDMQAWVPRNMVFANKAAFDGLSAAEKKAVIDSAKAADERGWKLSIEEMTVKTAALKNAGIAVVAPAPGARLRHGKHRYRHCQGMGDIRGSGRRSDARRVKKVIRNRKRWKLAGARRFSRRAPLQRISRPVSRVLYGLRREPQT